MPPLLQLMQPERYAPCDWDLLADDAGRDYWLTHFTEHLTTVLDRIHQTYPDADKQQVGAFHDAYLDLMQAIRANPAAYAPLHVLKLDALRQQLLEQHGFPDPFAQDKKTETERAARVLPELLDELAGLSGPDLLEDLAEGLLAGNFFDLGAKATIERYESGEGSFLEDRANLPARPWFEDDLDEWIDRATTGRPYRHVAFFVDNAGADVCLGCLPLVRYFLQQGARVTLCANTGPALNDITADELTSLVVDAVDADPWFADNRLHVVGTGNRAPLIDLTNLAQPCVDAIADADLIIIQGMGRAVESNRRATFTVDVLRTAVIKDEGLADFLGCDLFDCSFRYTPAP